MKRARPNILARFFDAMGYLLVAGEWLVLGLVYLPRLLETQFVQDYFTAPNEVKPTPVENPNAVEPSLLLIAFTTAAGVIFLLFVGYIIFRRYIPAVVHTSEKTIEKTVQEIVHLQEKHKPRMTAQKRSKLAARTRFWLKIIVAAVPSVLLLCFVRSHDSLVEALATLVVAVLALAAVSSFAAVRYSETVKELAD